MNERANELMLAFQKGDKEAFDELYMLLKPGLYSFIYRFTTNEQLSIDLVQDTFLQLQRKKEQYHPMRSSVKTYIFQIGYNLMVNSMNRRKKWQRLLPFLVPLDEEKIDLTDKIAVKGAVMNLPEEYRGVVLLKYYEDMTNKEIASVLEIPVGTVKSRLHYAIEKLRISMEVKCNEGKKSL